MGRHIGSGTAVATLVDWVLLGALIACPHVHLSLVCRVANTSSIATDRTVEQA